MRAIEIRSQSFSQIDGQEKPSGYGSQGTRRRHKMNRAFPLEEVEIKVT